MDNKYLIYFDSGTSNTRVYLLDALCNIRYTTKVAIGSKDSAIAGSNRIIIDTICSLYKEVLESCGLCDADIDGVYASGMLTSPYGLKEIPHLSLPITVKEFANSLYSYRENESMKRDIMLIPGLKAEKSDFSLVGNMRGEEIEVIGALEELKIRGVQSMALVMPGSHTHITYVKDGTVQDILSTFTGELFYALHRDTILAPVLDNKAEDLDQEMISMATDNLSRFGFNRAIYIGHSMRIMDRYTPAQRYAYCEGVINGGIRQALEYYLRYIWPDCDAIIFVCNEYMHRLFDCIFKGSELQEKTDWLPLTPDSCYAVKGLNRLIKEKGDR